MNHAVEVGVLFKISKGKKCQEVKNSPIRYLQIDDLRNNDNIKYAASDPSYVSCSKKDVLIAWDGANAGTIGYGLEGVIGSTLAKLVPQSDGVYPPYAGRFLQSKFRYLRDNCTGATIPHISRPSLQELKIPLPPLDEQKKIAAILDAADKLRKKDAQLIEKYNALSQSLFLDMFGDPVTNPMGWKKSKLSDSFLDSPRIGTTTPAFGGGDIKVVRVGELGHKKIKFSKCKSVSLSEQEKTRYLLHTGDIVLARAIGSINHLGKASLFENIGDSVVFDSHVMRLRFDENRMLPIFFYHWLQSVGGRSIFLKNAGQTAVQFNINAKQIARIRMNVPPIKLQAQFAERTQHIESQKQQAQAAQQKSEDLFNSLLQRAFKGELTQENEVSHV